MTAPRQVLEGATYLVTRRCAQRQFLLKPGRTTNEVFLYVLALAAQRYGVQVHAFCVLSNHFHLLVTDQRAVLPAFEQYLDSLVARALNTSLQRVESFWAPNSYSAVTLPTPEDVLDKAAYVLANPVAAGLVRSGREWPGLWSSPAQIGADAIQAPRPGVFFDPKGGLPKVAALELTVPAGFASAEAFRGALAAALAEREAQATQLHGPGVLGVAKVLAQEVTARATSEEPRGALSPRVAARDKWKRIEVLRRLVEFLRDYRAAWVARRRGVADVLFPAGTYWLRVAHGVPCAASG
jgi:REP element-mobilizing transposase RayT